MQQVQNGYMIMEVPGRCPNCEGCGQVAMCQICEGRGAIEETHQLDFSIPPGCADGEVLKIKGEGHQTCDTEPGEVRVRVLVAEHERFERKHDDLLVEVKLPLATALAGGNFELEHLDGRKLNVVVPSEGGVLQPGCVRSIAGEGMPKRSNPALRGELVVRFGVDFPKDIPVEKINELARILGKEEDATTPKDPVYLSNFDLDEFGAGEPTAEESCSDEEEGMMPQEMCPQDAGCPQQ